jgi:hypothetical protein
MCECVRVQVWVQVYAHWTENVQTM